MNRLSAACISLIVLLGAPVYTSGAGPTGPLAALVLAGGQPERRPDQPASRYTGQWVDGTRLSSSELSNWHQTAATPKLADRELFAPDRPIRWLVDNSLPVGELPEAVVELVGGDCLPGRVIAIDEGAESADSRSPPHLDVIPSQRLDGPDGPSRPAIGVALTWVRRVIWQRAGDRYRPRTVLLVDGRQLDFRSVRFSAAGLRLLRQDGVRDVALAEVAELHMPAVDPWDAYFEQVAALGLSPKARLIRLETISGLRVTGSTDRFRARSRGDAGKPANWQHMVQPAWSLDPLWLAHATIRVRQYFQPHEVPLGRIDPSAARQESDWGGVLWPWRADRSPLGGPLEAGGVPYPWGFGVHGRTDLEFPLPACARAFQSRVGLDQSAGSGGCVRARVFLDTAAGPPLYSSPAIVGSGEALDTGRLAWENRSPPPSRLILQVDSAHGDRPAGADPLDVRDLVDWLEPVIELDPEKVEAEVFRRGPRLIPAWQNWSVLSGGEQGVRLVSHGDESSRPDRGFRLLAAAGREGLRLSGKLSVRPYRDCLLLAVSHPPGSQPSRIEVRVEGEPIGQYDVPARSGPQPPPIVVSLVRYHGRQVTVELVQQSRSDRALVEWQAISLVNRTKVP